MPCSAIYSSTSDLSRHDYAGQQRWILKFLAIIGHTGQILSNLIGIDADYADIWVLLNTVCLSYLTPDFFDDGLVQVFLSTTNHMVDRKVFCDGHAYALGLSYTSGEFVVLAPNYNYWPRFMNHVYIFHPKVHIR